MKEVSYGVRKENNKEDSEEASQEGKEVVTVESGKIISRKGST